MFEWDSRSHFERLVGSAGTTKCEVRSGISCILSFFTKWCHTQDAEFRSTGVQLIADTTNDLLQDEPDFRHSAVHHLLNKCSHAFMRMQQFSDLGVTDGSSITKRCQQLRFRALDHTQLRQEEQDKSDIRTAAIMLRRRKTGSLHSFRCTVWKIWSPTSASTASTPTTADEMTSSNRKLMRDEVHLHVHFSEPRKSNQERASTCAS